MALAESVAFAQDRLNAMVEGSILANTVFGNRLFDWLLALAVFTVSMVVLKTFKSKLLHYLERLASKTRTKIDDFLVSIVARTGGFFFVALSLFLSSMVLRLPAQIGAFISKAAVVVLIVQAALWGNTLVTLWITHLVRERGAQDGTQATTFQALGILSRTILWILAVLLILDNVGVNIATLVTGLGIGGVAVALAVQSVLGDLLASLSIVLDKPFVVGDYVVIENHMGTVEHIGLRTTRVKALTGEQIVFSNTDILKARLHNYKRMQERRVLFSVSVVYGTPLEKVERIAQILETIISSEPKVRFDRAHFKELGASALVFEAVYFMLEPDYVVTMNTQQRINLRIMARFQEEGIEFAYPTQTVVLSKSKAGT